MKQRIFGLLIVGVAATLAACGGGGGGSSIAPPAKQNGAMGSIAVILKVPAKAAQARAHDRGSLRPAYLSRGTQGLGISTAIAPATPGPAASPDVAFDLSTCTPANFCVQNSDGSRTYTVVTPPLPVGNYNVRITTWDMPPASGHFAHPMGSATANPLSEALTSVAITTMNTPLNVTLNGIPATVQAVPLAGQAHVYGHASTTYDIVGNVNTMWSIVALDAAGYTIAGSGAPIISLSEPTGSLVTATTSQSNLFSITAVKAQASPVVVSITAQGFDAASGVTTTAVTIPVTPVQELWQTAGSYIYGYAMDPANSPPYSPVNPINCCGNGGAPIDILNVGTRTPQAIAADSAGFLWAYDSTGNQLVQYTQNSTGPPTETNAFSTSGLAIAGLVGDANGFIYGVDTNATPNGELDAFKVVGSGAPSLVAHVALQNSGGSGVAVVPAVSSAPATLQGQVMVATSGGLEFYTSATSGTPGYTAIVTPPSPVPLKAVAIGPDDAMLWILDTSSHLSTYTLSTGPSISLLFSRSTWNSESGYLSAGILDYAATSNPSGPCCGRSNNIYLNDPGKSAIDHIFSVSSPSNVAPVGSLITP